MSDDEKERLLRLLEAHGQQFLGSFGATAVKGKRKEVSEATSSRDNKKRRLSENKAQEPDPEEEWNGFSDEESSSEAEDDSKGASFSVASSKGPDVFVFSGPIEGAGPSSVAGNRAHQKAFMSSKVTKVTQNIADVPAQEEENDGEDDEKYAPPTPPFEHVLTFHRTNAQNDALLHRLVHTKILSGSLDPDLNLTPAQRRKALAGRVLEAAGKAKLGKGEHAVRSKERNKAAKHVRDGLLAKQSERTKKELEEAKNMGNYHPALKQLFEKDSGSNFKQKRERGLRMGVGTFSGGILRLNRDEIASASGRSDRPQNRKGGRRK
ncbi:hypothetical protein PHLCEN_2v10516 [Hermanssonia centrifuga]|uniref:Uncharacterized protein n=1 Tax=Hermanssonia centrifuga TaxID=98765 RepID=A0A2R6NMJ1_9APHY|nr:hypothetical protein PHLCEN_2v10516 [Hermanssonia centrifuga]